MFFCGSLGNSSFLCRESRDGNIMAFDRRLFRHRRPCGFYNDCLRLFPGLLRIFRFKLGRLNENRFHLVILLNLLNLFEKRTKNSFVILLNLFEKKFKQVSDY